MCQGQAIQSLTNSTFQDYTHLENYTQLTEKFSSANNFSV